MYKNMVKIKQLFTQQSKGKIFIFLISKKDDYNSKRGGMGLVINELNQSKTISTKITTMEEG